MAAAETSSPSEGTDDPDDEDLTAGLEGFPISSTGYETTLAHSLRQPASHSEFAWTLAIHVDGFGNGNTSPKHVLTAADGTTALMMYFDVWAGALEAGDLCLGDAGAFQKHRPEITQAGKRLQVGHFGVVAY